MTSDLDGPVATIGTGIGGLTAGAATLAGEPAKIRAPPPD